MTSSTSLETMQTMPPYYLLKLVMIGDSGVGKSSLVSRYADSLYTSEWNPTIGVDFKIRSFMLNNKVVKLQIWDTAGQERFRTLTSSYYRSAHGFLIVYDVTNKESFSHVPSWIEEILKHTATVTPSLPYVLVGNKCDLDQKRVIPTDAAQQMATSYQTEVYETSSKSDIHVDTIFRAIAFKMLSREIFIEEGEPATKLPSSRENSLRSFCC